MGRLRTVCYAPLDSLAHYRSLEFQGDLTSSGKVMFMIAVQDILGCCASLAFEYPEEEPGVIRWEIDYQCVPMFICEGMGWKNLRAQERALERKARALQALQELTEECDED